MSEAAEIRLVRCPKCHNLLQELNGYSVYECGGCGAVLRASKTNGDLETFAAKSDEKSIGGVSEKLDNLEFAEEEMNLSGDTEDDVMLIAKSLSKERMREVKHGKMRNLNDASPSEWVIAEGTKLDNKIDGRSPAKEGKGYEDLKPPHKNGSGFKRSGQMPDKRLYDMGQSEIEGFQSSNMVENESKKYSASSYSEGGPSQMHADVKYGESLNDAYGENRFDKVEYTGDDRAELLRTIDELKEQLTRSVEMADKPIEKDPSHGRNHHIASEDWFSDSSPGINTRYMQHRFPDNHPARASFMNHYVEPSAYVNVHAMRSHQSAYPNENSGSHSQGMNDPLRSRVPMRVQHAPATFQEQRSQGYLSRHYINSDLAQIDSYEAYAPNINYHHLSCTCLYCYKKNQVPDKRFSGIPCHRMSNHFVNPAGLHVPRDYGPGVPKVPQSQSCNLQTRSRLVREVGSTVSSFVPRRPPRIYPPTSGHYCRALAAGAPFVACSNCFELLKVPKKVMVQNGVHKKMRCGPCSSIISLDVSNKGLVVSVHEGGNQDADDTQVVELTEGNSHAQGRPNRVSLTLSSEDYDHSGYNFQSLDKEVVRQTIHQPVSKSLQCTSSSTSEDDANLDPMDPSPPRSNPSELPMDSKSTSTASGSSLQEYLEYSNKYHQGGRFGKGNRSRHSEPESLMRNKTSSRQNSMKDASEETEIDVSTNEYANIVTSLDSGEPSKEGVQLRKKKAGFLSDIIKKSFKDSKSNQKDEHEKANVTVNGHLVPVRLIKKAEKVAGPIQPGNYWYDFRAGFWGVMGGPCRGIIPPLIEEFSHTMPENCAGGNTGVFVNGRELHQTDFSLLVGRGLPNEMNRSYIIEISGRVLDGETGKELESLGKLAPTVERVKHGFGMKPPKATA